MDIKLLSAETFSAIVSELFGNEVTMTWRKCDRDEWEWCSEFNLCLDKVIRKKISPTGIEYYEVLFDDAFNQDQHSKNVDSFYAPLGNRLGFDLGTVKENRLSVTYIFAKEVDEEGMPQSQILIGGGCIY